MHWALIFFIFYGKFMKGNDHKICWRPQKSVKKYVCKSVHMNAYVSTHGRGVAPRPRDKISVQNSYWPLSVPADGVRHGEVRLAAPHTSHGMCRKEVLSGFFRSCVLIDNCVPHGGQTGSSSKGGASPSWSPGWRSWASLECPGGLCVGALTSVRWVSSGPCQTGCHAHRPISSNHHESTCYRWAVVGTSRP